MIGEDESEEREPCVVRPDSEGSEWAWIVKCVEMRGRNQLKMNKEIIKAELMFKAPGVVLVTPVVVLAAASSTHVNLVHSLHAPLGNDGLAIMLAVRQSLQNNATGCIVNQKCGSLEVFDSQSSTFVDAGAPWWECRPHGVCPLLWR